MFLPNFFCILIVLCFFVAKMSMQRNHICAKNVICSDILGKTSKTYVWLFELEFINVFFVNLTPLGRVSPKSLLINSTKLID